MLKALREIEALLEKHPHFLADEVEAVRSCAQKVQENAKLKEQMEKERAKKAEQHQRLASMADERHSVLEHITQTLSLYVDETPSEIQELYQYLLRQHLLIVKARDALAEELSAYVEKSTTSTPSTTSTTSTPSTFSTANTTIENSHNSHSYISGSPGNTAPPTESTPVVHTAQPDQPDQPAETFDEEFLLNDGLSSIINLDRIESNIRHRNLYEENLYSDEDPQAQEPQEPQEPRQRLDIIVEEQDDADDRPPSIARQSSL